MEIVITKKPNEELQVVVIRQDGSTESAIYNSRSFRHDFAHFAVESEIRIKMGYWGSIAGGGSLAGEKATGKDIEIAESLAGPVQNLMITEAEPSSYFEILKQFQPTLATPELAEKIHNRVRSLIGHWNATPYGSSMRITWDI